MPLDGVATQQPMEPTRLSVVFIVFGMIVRGFLDVGPVPPLFHLNFYGVPLHQIAHVRRAKLRRVDILISNYSSNNFRASPTYMTSVSQRHARRTDGRTAYDSITRAIAIAWRGWVKSIVK